MRSKITQIAVLHRRGMNKNLAWLITKNIAAHMIKVKQLSLKWEVLFQLKEYGGLGLGMVGFEHMYLKGYGQSKVFKITAQMKIQDSNTQINF